MRGTIHDLMNFWLTPWSKPIREACEWVVRFGPPLSGKAPNKVAPWWVRPFFLQAWVVQIITARLAWLNEHPNVPKERFGWKSETDWKRVVWTFAERDCLCEMDEATLREFFIIEVERMQRILLEAPGLVGNVPWTLAAMVSCAHLSQYYHELRQRQPPCAGQGRALRVRAILREELRRFVTWQPGNEAALGD